jgi:peptidoglycan hydrolase-like protein with peptidoglycan-binding domain
MPIDIHPRAVWAPYVTAGDLQDLASSPPRPSTRAWAPQAGVFIHYRGPYQPGDSDYADEADCRRDIAGVFLKDWVTGDGNGDVQYNWFVCLHGHVYEGRGRERGEANGDGYVQEPDGHLLGRNTAFYSICGLMDTRHAPTDAMLRSMRELIAYLRRGPDLPANRRTGAMILPHNHEWATDCPGHLHAYARRGSSIDPDAPWRGLADIHLCAAQRWLNRTYRPLGPGVYPGCPEDGYPSWQMVQPMTQALQYEHGISPTVPTFGPATFAAVRNRNTMPGDEMPGRENLVGIWNAALWCKGFFASSSLTLWQDASEDSLAQLYADAGLTYADRDARYRMWPHVARVLMRMDQFRRVSNGSTDVQRVQRRLNSRYVAGVGIPAMGLVPCDGVYSRDVQQGLMMGLQYELGIGLSAINGNFGPGTQSALRGRGSGQLAGDLRYLYRAACLFNSPTRMRDGATTVPLSYTPSDIDTDTGTASHVQWVRAFQDFSQIPVTGTNDYTTWAQLLVSSGDTGRPATGCDCITQITPARGQALYAAGYRIVGRYLDEHLPPTDPEYRGKALKPEEPQQILDAGLRFYPLFQWNNTELFTFDYGRGYTQGTKAHEKAVGYRIPAGTCIYFAVDYDATDDDIDANIKPYFDGVRTALNALGGRYTFGVYGSRNVCTRVSREMGARWSFVSGMSWGFSGNLGFPMPENWSFNQIREFEFQPGWGLDHNIWRAGADPGVSTLDPAE